MADPEISKRDGALKKGGVPNIHVAKNSRILGLKSWVLLTFYGKFGAKTSEVGGGVGPLNSIVIGTCIMIQKYSFCKRLVLFDHEWILISRLTEL